MTTDAQDMMIRRNLTTDMPMMEDYIKATHPSLPANRMAFADYLLNWEAAKERGDLFRLFGDSLIVSKKIKYRKNNNELRHEFEGSGTCELVWKLNENVIKIGSLLFKKEFSCRDSATVMRYCDDFYFYKMSRTADHEYVRRTAWGGFTGSDEYMKIMRDPVAHDLFDIFGIMVSMTSSVNLWLDNEASWPKNENSGEHNHPSVILPGTNKKFRINQNQKPIRVYSTFSAYLREWVEKCCNWSTPAKYEMQLMLDDFDDIIKKVRQAMSMVLNQADCHGELCVSIHPLDFMTMSDGGNGWTSCMQWVECGGGEYHSGTLEMMTSPCVVVAYLKGKDDISIGSGKYMWNKKKWRELFIVDHNFISGIKGYPYCSKSLEDTVFEILNDLAHENWNHGYDRDNLQVNSNNLLWVEDHFVKFETNFMYNDYQYTDCRLIPATGKNVFADTRPNRDNSDASTYYYGEQCFCIVCGKPRDIDDEEGSENSLSCLRCNHKEKCPECGEWCYTEDMITLPDGRRICDDCYDSMPSCDICGEVASENWVSFRYRHFSGNIYDRSICICDKCLKKYSEAGMIDENRYIIKVDRDLVDVMEENFHGLSMGSYRLYDIEWVGEGEKPNVF